MYNRYIRNDRGVYTRIPEDELSPSHRPQSASSGDREHPGDRSGVPQTGEPFKASPPPGDPAHHKTGPNASRSPSDGTGGITQALRRLLDRFHLDSIDSGDLLLLLLLFLLFREDADEELLFALGLLLIL